MYNGYESFSFLAYWEKLKFEKNKWKLNLLIINLKMNISNNDADIIANNLDFGKFKNLQYWKKLNWRKLR